MPAGPPPELTGDLPDPEAYFAALREDEARGETAPAVPERYANADTSELAVTIVPGENRPTLNLVDQAIAP
jgi:hypothetical protein